jgi:hypothetical protein
MMIAILLLVLMVLGLVLWYKAVNPRTSEAGRILYFVALFVLLLRLSPEWFAAARGWMR